MKKREISAADFAAWSKTYQHALNNYSAGLTYYRTLVWHGKTGKAAPKDKAQVAPTRKIQKPGDQATGHHILNPRTD